MRFMEIESVLQTINRSEPAKNRFSVALVKTELLMVSFRLYILYWPETELFCMFYAISNIASIKRPSPT